MNGKSGRQVTDPAQIVASYNTELRRLKISIDSWRPSCPYIPLQPDRPRNRHKLIMTIRLICCGTSVLDRIWPLPELPAGGGKYHARDYLELGGGMAATASVAAARLGAQTAFWGRAGNDSAGHVMQQELARHRVDVSHFQLYDGVRSSVSAILVANSGERMIVTYRDPSMPTDASWLPLDNVKGCQAVLADIRWVEGASALYRQARALGIPTVIDAEKAEPDAFSTLLPLVDHAIFSDPGLRAFGGDARQLDDAARIAALRQVRALGCTVAAVTLGAQGTLWLDDAGVHRQPVFAVRTVDTTGAGDVFHGAYTLALGEGRSVASAMVFASAVSAIKCTGLTSRASIPGRDEVDAFLAERQT